LKGGKRRKQNKKKKTGQEKKGGFNQPGGLTLGQIAPTRSRGGRVPGGEGGRNEYTNTRGGKKKPSTDGATLNHFTKPVTWGCPGGLEKVLGDGAGGKKVGKARTGNWSPPGKEKISLTGGLTTNRVRDLIKNKTPRRVEGEEITQTRDRKKRTEFFESGPTSTLCTLQLVAFHSG